MDRFVANLNIQHFKQRLAEEKDPGEVHRLKKLLEEEEAKLARIEADKRLQKRR